MFKKLQFLFALLVALLALPERSMAAPGDTTRVTIFNRRPLTHYGNYDTTTVMPTAGRRYRKVLMHYILSRYACPPGTQYCGSWDYTTRVILRPPAHDSLELARIMTPYATDWLASDKSHDYVVDVTDYAPLLVGNPGFRFEYQGYSWGFRVTVRLDFIEGTPPQDPIDVRNVYNGTFAYGVTADPIENYLSVKNFTAPSAGTIALKSLISGHGADPANCAEFCRRFYSLYVNNTLRGNTWLWRDDCGKNEVYPQTGTWVYNRGNWCPGAVVRRLVHPLTNITTPGQPFSLDINMQAYTASNQTAASAQYIWSSQLVSSGAINFQTDASLDEIIAPNSNENYVRENPTCGGPQVRLRNLGSNRLTAVTIAYRVKGRGPLQTYNWTGNLSYGRDTLVSLPPLTTLMNNTTGGNFQAWTTSPNTTRDQNAYNDTLTTKFSPTITLPGSVTINMTTNGANTFGIINETSWQIVDVAGNVVSQRVNANSTTTFNDNLRLAPGCYSLRVTDAGCDGFAWWASPSVGNGTMRILNSAGSVLRTISGDFGCEYTLNFQVAGTVSSAATAQLLNALDVYPNPSHDGQFNLDLNLPTSQDVQLRVIDALGRQVRTQKLAQVKASVQPLNLTGVAPGVYALEVRLADGTKLNRRLVID
jgi:hypothetical protein